jgi:potassium voltage-gated channel Eag-related subfamily H protein 8
MLSPVPLAGKEFPLSVYNGMWTDSPVPDTCTEVIVNPVLKPDGDRSQANNYRPISLTSRLCNTMERMVNSRLVWVLGSRNLFSGAQCGFRRRRSALDHLVKLDYHVQIAFLLHQHLVAVFFDLEKAYDASWLYSILRTLHR